MTDLPNDGSSSGSTVFRLRAGAGGVFTYETIGVLAANVDGKATQARLTLGGDGLLYGSALEGGPSGNGTLFRFDPNGGGPPANPIAFTVLHAFPQLNTWDPSAPVRAGDGFLYGVTNAGGAANRGAVYRLNAVTGAVAILGDVPAASTPHIVNSALVPGPDGLLYGTSVAGPSVIGTPTPAEFHILRVTPASGTSTVAVGPIPESAAPVGLVRTTAGTTVRSAAPPGAARHRPLRPGGQHRDHRDVAGGHGVALPLAVDGDQRWQRPCGVADVDSESHHRESLHETHVPAPAERRLADRSGCDHARRRHPRLHRSPRRKV